MGWPNRIYSVHLHVPDAEMKLIKDIFLSLTSCTFFPPLLLFLFYTMITLFLLTLAAGGERKGGREKGLNDYIVPSKKSNPFGQKYDNHNRWGYFYDVIKFFLRASLFKIYDNLHRKGRPIHINCHTGRTADSRMGRPIRVWVPTSNGPQQHRNDEIESPTRPEGAWEGRGDGGGPHVFGSPCCEKLSEAKKKEDESIFSV
jgi:hypothetical protein